MDVFIWNVFRDRFFIENEMEIFFEKQKVSSRREINFDVKDFEVWLAWSWIWKCDKRSNEI